MSGETDSWEPRRSGFKSIQSKYCPMGSTSPPFPGPGGFWLAQMEVCSHLVWSLPLPEAGRSHLAGSRATAEKTCVKTSPWRDFPGGTVEKTLCSQCRGPRFDPWSGRGIGFHFHAATRSSRAATKEPVCHSWGAGKLQLRSPRAATKEPSCRN